MIRMSVLLAIASVIIWSCSDDDNGNGNGQASDFDINVIFTEFTPHIGQMLGLYVKDSATGDIIADTLIDTISAADFTVTFNNIAEPGKDYIVGIFADYNENGIYDVPPEDHAWQFVIIDADSDQVLNLVHNTDFTDIAFPVPEIHSLSMNFLEMSPHLNQTLIIYIVDNVYRNIIEDTSVTILSDSFEIQFGDILVDGRGYNVDFYADFNENGEYDVPPVDHAWRRTIDPAASDTIITFVHDTIFTDIMAE
jgi:hypothetical protein